MLLQRPISCHSDLSVSIVTCLAAAMHLDAETYLVVETCVDTVTYLGTVAYLCLPRKISSINVLMVVVLETFFF